MSRRATLENKQNKSIWLLGSTSFCPLPPAKVAECYHRSLYCSETTSPATEQFARPPPNATTRIRFSIYHQRNDRIFATCHDYHRSPLRPTNPLLTTDTHPLRRSRLHGQVQQPVMDNTINFDINDALKYLNDPASIPTPEADSALFDCENDPDSLTNAVINPVLNPIVDAIAENPEAITRSAHFDSLQFLLKCAPSCVLPIPYSHSSPTEARPARSRKRALQQRSPDNIGLDSELFNHSRYTAFLPAHALSKIFDVITSGLAAETEAVAHDLESDEQDLIAHHKQLLGIYSFLMQWTIACVETKAAEKSSAAPTARRGVKPKGKKAATAGAEDGNWDSAMQLQTALDTMCKVLRLKLAKIFLTTSERDTFIGLVCRPVYLILESEQRVKNTPIRMHAFKVLCMAVKHHGHGYGMSGDSVE